jgi:hypothetical protein
MNLNLNSCSENLFKTSLDNKLAYIYQIYAIIKRKVQDLHVIERRKEQKENRKMNREQKRK